MSPTMELGLIFLIFTTVIMLILVGAFLIKLLIDLSKLTCNIDETTTIVKQEIEPTLKELKETVQGLNSLAHSADKQIDALKKVLSSLLGIGGAAFCGLKSFSGLFLKGLLAGMKLFKKRR